MFAHVIAGDLAVGGRGGQHEDLALGVGDIESVAGLQHGTPEPTSQAVLPDGLAGFDIDALGEPRIVGDVEMTVVNNTRPDPLGCLFDVPQTVRGGDVAPPAHPDRHHRLAEPTDTQQHAVADGRVRIIAGSQALALPERLPGQRVVSFQLAGHRQCEFVPVTDPVEDRGRPRSVQLVILAHLDGVPDGSTGPFVECHDVGGFSGSTMSDQQVLVEHRRGGRTEDVCQWSELTVPDDLAGKITGDDAGRTETGIDQVAVGGGRPGTERVVVVGGFLVGKRDVVVPEFAAGLAIDADQAADLATVAGTGDKDPVVPDDRCRVALAGQRGFPGEIGCRAKFHRQVGVGTDPASVGPAPGWPVAGVGGATKQQEDSTCHENGQSVHCVVAPKTNRGACSPRDWRHPTAGDGMDARQTASQAEVHRVQSPSSSARSSVG